MGRETGKTYLLTQYAILGKPGLLIRNHRVNERFDPKEFSCHSEERSFSRRHTHAMPSWERNESSWAPELVQMCREAAHLSKVQGLFKPHPARQCSWEGGA